jgi:fumarate hydratase subunit beta
MKESKVCFPVVEKYFTDIIKYIVYQEVIAFPELGPEALRKLEVKDFPVFVVIDSYGNNLYKIGQEKYKII